MNDSKEYKLAEVVISADRNKFRLVIVKPAEDADPLDILLYREILYLQRKTFDDIPGARGFIFTDIDFKNKTGLRLSRPAVIRQIWRLLKLLFFRFIESKNEK
jgi:hypothetical protein